LAHPSRTSKGETMQKKFIKLLGGAAISLGVSIGSMAQAQQPWKEHWANFAATQYKDQISTDRILNCKTIYSFLVTKVETVPQAKVFIQPLLDEAMASIGFIHVPIELATKMKNETNNTNMINDWASTVNHSDQNYYISADENSLNEMVKDIIFFNSRTSETKVNGRIRDINIGLHPVIAFDPAKNGFVVTIMPVTQVFGSITSGIANSPTNPDIRFIWDGSPYSNDPAFYYENIMRDRIIRTIDKYLQTKFPKEQLNIQPS
jgi:hypothetical protein